MKSLVLAVMLSCLSLMALGLASSFKSAEVISATDFHGQYQVLLDGIVVLDVSLNAKGKVKETKALRDPGSMVPVASSSVRTWSFRPASEAGMPERSEITTVFVYRPPVNFATVVNFKPVLPYAELDPKERPDYIPAGIVSLAYPEYPVNSVATGSVVVQVTVSNDGTAEDVQVIRDQALFTKFALDALKKWEFQAATFHDKAVRSKVAIAFVFVPPYVE